MNKKILCGTLSGILIGGIGLTLTFVNLITNHEDLNKSKTLDIDLCIISIIGSIMGGMMGTAFGQAVSNCIEQCSEREAYREFFESQRIENNPNELVNESTPLLQEHIININNEENLLNINNISNYSQYNSL